MRERKWFEKERSFEREKKIFFFFFLFHLTPRFSFFYSLPLTCLPFSAAARGSGSPTEGGGAPGPGGDLNIVEIGPCAPRPLPVRACVPAAAPAAAVPEE